MPSIKGIMALLVISLIWLIANQVGLIGIQQFALITMIQLFVWSILGGTVYKKLLFPLLFLYLAVPFGDFLIKPMMELTADFTVMVLRLTGIPVYRNGLFFMLPTGHWSVVAACSGVRYLIASLTIGILFAYFSYSSWHKRLLFTAASIITPIIANSLRAYLIVLIGHFSNMELATGIDHFVYGWLFFGIVIAMMMWVGSKFQDQPQHVIENQPRLNTIDPIDTTVASLFAISDSSKKPIIFAVLGLLVSAIGPLSAYVLNQQPQQQVNLASIVLPETIVNWHRTNDVDDWQPNYSGQKLQLSSIYQSQLGRVQLTMIFYANETHGNELTNGQNSLFPEDDSDWRLVLESSQSISLPPYINLHESLIEADQYRLVWQFNWINGELTINDVEAKWMAVKNRLRGQNNRSVAVIISTQSEEDTANAQQRLKDFIQTMSSAIFKIMKQFESLGT
jgi:exosortase A